MKGLLILFFAACLFVVDSAYLKQKRSAHEDEHHDHRIDHRPDHKTRGCLPITHPCKKGRHDLCCSGWCGMAHSGDGNPWMANQMKYGTCLGKRHDPHHDSNKKTSALDAIFG